jgi:hypothetical protein
MFLISVAERTPNRSRLGRTGFASVSEYLSIIVDDDGVRALQEGGSDDASY